MDFWTNLQPGIKSFTIFSGIEIYYMIIKLELYCIINFLEAIFIVLRVEKQ